jgi:hypothetical protein
MAIKWKKLLSVSSPDLAALADLWDSVHTPSGKEENTKKGKKRKKENKEMKTDREENDLEESQRKRKRCSNCN